MARNVKTLVSKAKQGGNDLAEAIEDIRTEIIITKEKRHEIADAVVSKDEALDRISAWADALRREDHIVEMAKRFIRASYREPIPADTIGILVSVLAEQIRVAMTASVSTIYAAGIHSLSAEERRNALQEIDDEHIALELAEETIIRTAEAAGLDVLRRSDADPHAVLARQEDLG